MQKGKEVRRLSEGVRLQSQANADVQGRHRMLIGGHESIKRRNVQRL